MIARKIYWMILLLSIMIGIYFYVIAPGNYNRDFLALFALLPFFLFTLSIHGLLAHSFSPLTKGGLIIFPLIMGFIFALLFFIHLFIILPVLFPEFHNLFK
jgi:hypothetical protein